MTRIYALILKITMYCKSKKKKAEAINSKPSDTSLNNLKIVKLALKLIRSDTK